LRIEIIECDLSGGKIPPLSAAMSSSLVLPSTDSSIGPGHTDLPLDQLSSDLSRRKSSSISIPLPPDISSRITDLEHENDVLRRQLEKIGKLDGLAIERSSRPSSRDRREQSISRDRSAGSGRKEVDRLRMENLELVERLREQADDLMAMKQERESLLLTIQLLQDDLTTSERHRHRLTPT
jgi:hypothetical protein